MLTAYLIIKKYNYIQLKIFILIAENKNKIFWKMDGGHQNQNIRYPVVNSTQFLESNI